MHLRSFSASSANAYESCPAMWKALYGDQRATDISGSSANLGTACHMVFEWFIQYDLHTDPRDTWVMACKPLWDKAYWSLFADNSRYAEGFALVEKWLLRQDFTGRSVLMTETKLSIEFQTSQGPVPFNFIFDRVDRLDDGSIEVIDYKSVIMPVQPGDLKERIQSRCYAMAAHALWPEATAIMVTFDLLRYEPVGIEFTIEEADEIRGYVAGLMERVIADETAVETLNDECRWCIRRNVCETLDKYEVVAGTMISDPVEAAELRYLLDCKKKALVAQIAEMDDVLEKYLKDNKTNTFDAGLLTVSLAPSSQRYVNVTKLAEVIGSDEVLKMASVGIMKVDELIKNGGLSEEDRAMIRQATGKSWGNANVSVKPKKKRK